MADEKDARVAELEQERDRLAKELEEAKRLKEVYETLARHPETQTEFGLRLLRDEWKQDAEVAEKERDQARAEVIEGNKRTEWYAKEVLEWKRRAEQAETKVGEWAKFSADMEARAVNAEQKVAELQKEHEPHTTDGNCKACGPLVEDSADKCKVCGFICPQSASHAWDEEQDAHYHHAPQCRNNPVSGVMEQAETIEALLGSGEPEYDYDFRCGGRAAIREGEIDKHAPDCAWEKARAKLKEVGK